MNNATTITPLTKGNRTIARYVIDTETFDAWWEAPLPGAAGTLVEWARVEDADLNADLDDAAYGNAAFIKAHAIATENL